MFFQCVTGEQVKLLCYLSGVVFFEAARVNLMNVLGTIGKILITSDSTDILEPVQVRIPRHVFHNSVRLGFEQFQF